MIGTTNPGDWIGRSHEVRDIASAAPMAGFDALLDRPPHDAANAPPLAHWLYFLPVARQSELGTDGHPRLGKELPDLGLPRRMWAGSRVIFHHPIAFGTPITRRTTILSIDMKQGSSGPLGFVTLKHEITSQDLLLVSDEQTLVYREASTADPVQAGPGAPHVPHSGEILATRHFDAIELFRFSALTGNTHRIHYDADYARDIEGYPGLVVHGPFQAMVLMDLFRQRNPSAEVTSFEFRATGPLFAGEEAEISLESSEPAILRICPPGRPPSMKAAIHTKVRDADTRPR